MKEKRKVSADADFCHEGSVEDTAINIIDELKAENKDLKFKLSCHTSTCIVEKQLDKAYKRIEELELMVSGRNAENLIDSYAEHIKLKERVEIGEADAKNWYDKFNEADKRVIELEKLNGEWAMKAKKAKSCLANANKEICDLEANELKFPTLSEFSNLQDDKEKVESTLADREADLIKLMNAVDDHRRTSDELNEGAPDWDHDAELYAVRDGIK